MDGPRRTTENYRWTQILTENFKFIDGILDILHWYRGDDDFGVDLNRFETPSQKVLKYW